MGSTPTVPIERLCALGGIGSAPLDVTREDTMPRRSTFAALAVLALVGAAGCGGSEDDGVGADPEAEGSRCQPVPAWFLRDLKDGAREEGKTLGDSAAVQSSDSFEGPLHIEKAWFVSADVRPKPGTSAKPRIETWFMSDEIFRTGQTDSGARFITGAGPEPSAWGPGSQLDFFGISPASDGLMESVECVGKVSP